MFINKSIVVANTFGIQEYDSVMCGYFCIGFIALMLAGKTLTNLTNLFTPNNFKNNDMLLKYFMTNVKKCDWTQFSSRT